MKLTIFLATISLATSAFAHGLSVESDDARYFMKFKAKNKYERSAIADLGVSIEATVEDSVTAIGSDEQLKAAKKSGKLETFFKLTNKMLDFPDEDSNFHNYNELTQELQALAAAHPGLITLGTIGNSLEGRQIPILTFSTVDDDKSMPAAFFVGGHHAREHISVETPLKLAQYLAEHYAAGDQRIVSLLNARTVYIVPQLNVDGSEYDIASGDYKLWRKNRRQNSNRTYGVDLNRNYGFGWGGGGSSSSPSSDIYRGTTAFSEPETQAVKAFFESHENITIDLSFHTFSKLILYPWGHKYDNIANARDFAVHKTMAEKMAEWNGYTPQQSSELYIASGDTTDWAYGQLGLISFTFELDPDGNTFNPARGFYPGQDFIQPVFDKNLEPALYIINYAANPYAVIDSVSEQYGFKSPILK